MLNFVSMFSGGDLSHATMFGLGIMPYISASIIFQLLAQRLSPAGEAEEGRRERAEEDQRIHPLRHRVICLFQCCIYVQYIMSPQIEQRLELAWQGYSHSALLADDGRDHDGRH